jgi:hypothetical protein
MQMNDEEIEKFLKDRENTQLENLRVKKLINRYKSSGIIVTPCWNRCLEAQSFNDTCTELTSNGVLLYEDSTDDIFKKIDLANIFEANTLWCDRTHCLRKISKIIEFWENEEDLAPPFFIRKEGGSNIDSILLQDGKHRVTVARAMNAKTIPFFIKKEDKTWIETILPNAKKLM